MQKLPPSTTPTAKRRRFLIDFAFFALIFILSVIAVRYALPALFPFVIAFLVTLILRPVVKFFNTKLKINRRIISVVLVVLFYGTIGILVIWMIIEILQFIAGKIVNLPDFFQTQVRPILDMVFDEIQQILHNFDPDSALNFDDTVNSLLSSLSKTVLNFSSKLITNITNIAVSVPSFLLNLVIMVIATIFLLVDYEDILLFVKRQLSDKTNDLLHNISTHLGRVIRKYLISYSLIMFITFCEIWAGLAIIGVKHSALIAILIAVFDILPVVGSGLIIVPWAIVSFILGDIGTGIGLFILWAVLCIVRQIIEPKIIGDNVGMHPFVTLFAMLAGNFIYGGIGILLVPITLALCQSLNRAGVVKIYKSVEPEPEEEDPIQHAISKGVDAAGVWITKPFKKRLKKKKAGKATKAKKEENSPNKEKNDA